MFQQMKKHIKNEKGLTLIELLAVVVILSIIAAIAIPAIGNIIDNSRSKAVIADAQNVMSAANIYFTDQNKKTNDTFTQTDIGSYLESTGKIATFKVTKGAPNTIEFTLVADSGVTLPEGTGTLTLEQLNKATVEAGVIKWGTATTPTPTP